MQGLNQNSNVKVLCYQLTSTDTSIQGQALGQNRKIFHIANYKSYWAFENNLNEILVFFTLKLR